MEDLSAEMPGQVLFVCTGNTCRSPMAEYLFRMRAGSDCVWRAVSAGVAAASGQPASPEAIRVLSEFGVDLTPHRSRLLTAELVDSSAWIVVMTRAHKEEVLRRFPAAASKVRLLTDFSGPEPEADIFDPLGGGMSVYRRVRARLDSALADLILTLREQVGAVSESVPPKGNA